MNKSNMYSKVHPILSGPLNCIHALPERTSIVETVPSNDWKLYLFQTHLGYTIEIYVMIYHSTVYMKSNKKYHYQELFYQ